MRLRLALTAAVACALLLGGAGTYWIAHPTTANLELPPPLKAFKAPPASDSLPYAKNLAPLVRGFRPQTYRSFCGPATIATVLRAYGVQGVDQTSVFPSWTSKLKAFYTGMTLAELADLARSDGLNTELIYADAVSLHDFRERLKESLTHEGVFVVVNYDRRVLKQSGLGHISPVADYDEQQDAFLVLDEAAYHYPFTWVPAKLLYEAVHTQSEGLFRGVLIIRGHSNTPQ